MHMKSYYKCLYHWAQWSDLWESDLTDVILNRKGMTFSTAFISKQMEVIERTENSYVNCY